MARKHSKQHAHAQSVTRKLIKPAVVSKERVAREVEKGTQGAIPVTQDDGTIKWFIVGFKEVSPAVYTVKADGPTTKRGKPNKPENMAPKGKTGSAPLMRKKGS